MKAEFFILGALHRGDLHPYEIKRRLQNALVECYTDVDVGTLYYAVRQLAKTGEIASRRSEKVARGGERTVYRITPKGKKRFQQLLLERFRQEGSVAQTIYPVLLFLHLAPRSTVSGLLRRRLQQIDLDLTKARAMRHDLGTVLGTGGRHLLGSLDRNTSARSSLVATATQGGGDRESARPQTRSVEAAGSTGSGCKETFLSKDHPALLRFSATIPFRPTPTSPSLRQKRCRLLSDSFAPRECANAVLALQQ